MMRTGESRTSVLLLLQLEAMLLILLWQQRILCKRSAVAIFSWCAIPCCQSLQDAGVCLHACVGGCGDVQYMDIAVVALACYA